MAEQQENRQQPQEGTQNEFGKGMNKDLMDSFMPPGTWSHARNGVANLPDGQLGSLSTEPSNIECVTLPYTLIGSIPLADDQWMLFMTDNVSSEIGIFQESQCLYTTTANSPCLNFNTTNLITGAARRGFDCGFDVYWSDGARNPDRFINTAKVPWFQDCSASTATCQICVDTTILDCEKLRIAPHFTIPCLQLAKSEGSGTLLNGSYQIAMRYTINEIPCTDFVALSNIISLWSHNNLAGAVKLTLTGTDTTQFDEMEVVIVSMVNFQVSARKLGIYSTRQSVIYVDNIDLTLETVPISLLPLNTPAIEKSDAIYAIGGYLTRVGIYEKADFNYQPRANQIIAKWACIAYPGDYYHKGGNSLGMNVGHMRDDVYAYYIRWVYLSGDKSASYNIPGLPEGTINSFSGTGPGVPGSLGTVASGRFVGYSSTEIYPDNQPLVWGALCGQPIMHHKFPDPTYPGGNSLSHFTSAGNIQIMGVYFENIQLPVDNNGVIIPDIQGYEILRAVREGHKQVIAKGIVNHMRGYTDPYTGREGLYQNYPYDDLRADNYLTTDVDIINNGSANTPDDQHHNTDSPLTIVHNDIVSFHSPETVFDHPVLGTGNLKVIQEIVGVSTGYYQQTYRHPKFKTLTNFSSVLVDLVAAVELILDIVSAIAILTGGNPPEVSLSATEDIPMNVPLFLNDDYSADIADEDVAYVGKLAGGIANVAVLAIMEPIKLKVLQQQIMTIVNGLAPARAFAWQWNSSGQYTVPANISGAVCPVTDYQYTRNHLSDFDNKTLNNLWRNNYVAMKLGVSLPGRINADSSRNTMYDRSVFIHDNDTLKGPYVDPIACFYASYKVPQLSQYGQIDSTKQVPISCVFPVDPTGTTAFFSTPVLFGGDTYICRYTEKNPFYFFNDWLFSQPNDFEYNYRNYINIPYPRYWIDNSKLYSDFLDLASKVRHLDAQENGGDIDILFATISTYVKNGAFYLFCNGVRDFYVETEVNVGYRDYGDLESEQFYDPYGFQDIALMFRSDIIKSDILYKYDYSLSASRFFNQYISWGQCLRRDYDPLLAYTCFAYYPRRLAYSLPQEEELKKDNWRLFLPNNYKDFNSKVTAIKEIHKNGAIILYRDAPPDQFIGTSTIASSSGTEYTVGTGALFQQDLLSVSNADAALQYGSSQSRFSIVNTPYGVFWVSQNTGKIFNYHGQEGMRDITPGLKWHLSLYLPSQLLQQFPTYPYTDNPVMGVGVQCIYDNINEILYICKRDFKALPGIIWNGTDFITSVFGMVIKVSTGDPRYFKDCSWTLSYDCKSKQYISWHDWFPSLNIPAKTHFLTTEPNSGRTLWRHNKITTSFCSFYNVQFPFEVCYYASTGAQTTVLNSIECVVDSNLYRTNQTDKFLQFDGFFDRAIIFNREQNSGWLELNLQPWNNPYLELSFPFQDAFGTQILYSRIENKWRFNCFYDLTDDRGEFTLGIVQMFNTDSNGYTFTLNPLYIDTLKPWNQRKKIRGRGTFVFLRKNIPGNNALTLIFNRSMNQNSPR